MGSRRIQPGMSLNLVRARVSPENEPALLDVMQPQEGDDPYTAHVRDALRKGHRSGQFLYFAVEGAGGGDPLRIAKDILDDLLVFVSVTSIDTKDEGDDDDDEGRPAKGARQRAPSRPKPRSHATREED